MEIILLKEVKNLGRKGDIKNVPDGYARNFLLPGGLAEAMTRHSAKMIQAQKAKRSKLALVAEKDKSRLARQIDGQTIAIKAKADDSGTLYAGLDKKAIAAELKKQGYGVSPEDIRLEAPIKKIGTVGIELKLGKSRTAVKLAIDKL